MNVRTRFDKVCVVILLLLLLFLFILVKLANGIFGAGAGVNRISMFGYQPMRIVIYQLKLLKDLIKVKKVLLQVQFLKRSSLLTYQERHHLVVF